MAMPRQPRPSSKNSDRAVPVDLSEDFGVICGFLAKLPIVRKVSPDGERDIHIYVDDDRDLYLELILDRVGVRAWIGSVDQELSLSGTFPRDDRGLIKFLAGCDHLEIRGQRLRFFAAGRSSQIAMSRAAHHQWVSVGVCPSPVPYPDEVSSRIALALEDSSDSQMYLDFSNLSAYFRSVNHFYLTLPAQFTWKTRAVDLDFLRLVDLLPAGDRVIGLCDDGRCFAASGSIEIVCPCVDREVPDIAGQMKHFPVPDTAVPFGVIWQINGQMPNGRSVLGVSASERFAVCDPDMPGMYCVSLPDAVSISENFAVQRKYLTMAHRIFGPDAELFISSRFACLQDDGGRLFFAACSYQHNFGSFGGGNVGRQRPGTGRGRGSTR